MSALCGYSQRYWVFNNTVVTMFLFTSAKTRIDVFNYVIKTYDSVLSVRKGLTTQCWLYCAQTQLFLWTGQPFKEGRDWKKQRAHIKDYKSVIHAIFFISDFTSIPLSSAVISACSLWTKTMHKDSATMPCLVSDVHVGAPHCGTGLQYAWLRRWR